MLLEDCEGGNCWVVVLVVVGVVDWVVVEATEATVGVGDGGDIST